MKKFGTILFAVLVIGAVAASSAFATVETKAAQWYTGPSAASQTTLVGSQPVTAEVDVEGTLETEIGGLKVKLKSKKFSCRSCTIENKVVGTGAGVIASGTGKITFEEVSVVEPANCTVSDSAEEGGTLGMVSTKQLNIHGDWMDTNTANKHAFIAFVPAAGATTTFAQFVLGGTGCSSISGAKNVTGTVFGESANNTEVPAEVQTLSFSPTIQATAGAELKVGTKVANFTGAGNFRTPVPGKTFFEIK